MRAVLTAWTVQTSRVDVALALWTFQGRNTGDARVRTDTHVPVGVWVVASVDISVLQFGFVRCQQVGCDHRSLSRVVGRSVICGVFTTCSHCVGTKCTAMDMCTP